MTDIENELIDKIKNSKSPMQQMQTLMDNRITTAVLKHVMENDYPEALLLSALNHDKANEEIAILAVKKPYSELQEAAIRLDLIKDENHEEIYPFITSNLAKTSLLMSTNNKNLLELAFNENNPRLLYDIILNKNIPKKLLLKAVAHEDSYVRYAAIYNEYADLEILAIGSKDKDSSNSSLAKSKLEDFKKNFRIGD